MLGGERSGLGAGEPRYGIGLDDARGHCQGVGMGDHGVACDFSAQGVGVIAEGEAECRRSHGHTVARGRVAGAPPRFPVEESGDSALGAPANLAVRRELVTQGLCELRAKLPLRLVDDVGSPDLRPANFVAVDVQVSESQSIRVIGIVVRWAERSRYLDHLPAALDANLGPKTIVAGDFNHRHPSTGRLALQLEETLTSRGLSIHTAGPHPQLGDERPLIDHIASTADLDVAKPVAVWPRHDPSYRNGTKEVTDHAGSAVDFVI
jgi:endonuclease/exonuclease/phosphatase family metal-dependent hydrolase